MKNFIFCAVGATSLYFICMCVCISKRNLKLKSHLEPLQTSQQTNTGSKSTTGTL